MEANNNRPISSPFHPAVQRQAADSASLPADCWHEGELDVPNLLSYCIGLKRSGPELFASLCAQHLVDPPEIPIGLIEFREALRHAGVTHVVICRLPGELNHLDAVDKGSITQLGLCFDQTTNPMDLASAARMLRGYPALSGCLLNFEEAAAPSLVDTMCGLLADEKGPPLRNIQLCGNVRSRRDVACSGLERLLKKKTLRHFCCVGPFAASLTSRALRRVRPGEVALTQLTLNSIPAASADRLSTWLDALNHPDLDVDITIEDRYLPELLIAQLQRHVRRGTLRLNWIYIEMADDTGTRCMQPIDPLVLQVARLSIKDELDRQPGPKTLSAFSEYLPLHPAGSEKDQNHKQVALGQVLSGNLSQWIVGNDVQRIGSATTRSREAFDGELPIRHYRAVVAWARRRLERNVPEKWIVAILSLLYPQHTHVINDLMIEARTLADRT